MYVAVVFVLLVRLLQTEAQLPPLQPTGQGMSGVHSTCDDCSDSVQLNISFPFGNYCHTECHISVNGIISFGEHFLIYSPEAFPGSTATVFFGYLLAPFWVDGDIRRGGNITWEVLVAGGGALADQYLSQVSAFIEGQQNTTFAGNWLMVVNYNSIPPFLSSTPTNTFQAVIITNGTKSYAVFTYKCPDMDWGDSFATIGFNAGGTYFENHSSSGSSTVTNIDCLALPQLVNNVVYDLVPSPGSVQCSTPTPEPPVSLETCIGSGYTTCCSTTCSSTSLECFCDPTCHFFDDCCRDIDEICPRGNFTLGETYLLFANSFHINRVSVDGSSFEILYDDPAFGGIVALDFDYRGDRMYWSDVNSGSLSRAYLNGSSAEVILNTSDPSVYDLAVDWVNGKVYWTEDTRGDVLVMDLETRQKRKLIANYNSSTTRAIVVDPTTRYMYWTDWGDGARIERAGMDGSERTILHNTRLVWPNGLTLDIPGQKIYWIDANLDTIEFSFTNGSGRTLLDRRDDDIFHPFSITLADDFLFWTDWSQLTIFTTHRDRPNDNIVALNLFSPLLYPPHGIEAVTIDRQPDAANPCASASCNSSALCLLSPTSPEGYTCVCADGATDCKDAEPTPLPTEPPLSPLAGYTSCCEQGLCRGKDILTGDPASCTCDSLCGELGTCCTDVAITCPDFHRLCRSAGHTQCCPAGSGCRNLFNYCSCDEDCSDSNNCCQDTLMICQNVTVPTSTPTIPTPVTTSSVQTPLPTTPSPTLPPITEVPGSVVTIETASISDTTLRVSWAAPSSGGRPESYQVRVEVASGETVASSETENLFVIISELVPEVPYYVTVEAANSLGSGEAATTTAFTREGTPSVAPVPALEWLSATEMKVSWSSLSLEEARGFLTGYTVTYSTTEKKRQVGGGGGGMKTVSADETSVTIDGLSSERQYSVSVAGVTGAGTGVASEPITAPSAGTLFQLQLLDIPSCDEWNSVPEDERISAIISAVLSHVKEECTNCDLQAADIASRYLTLQCSSDPITATFRALLLGDPQQNELITNNIEKWVELKGDISLGDFTVKLNSECEVVIDSMNEEICTVEPPSSPPTTIPTTKPPITSGGSPDTAKPSPVTSEPSSNRRSDNTAGIVVPIVIIIVIVIVAIVVMVVVIVLFRRRQAQKSDPYLNFEEQETTGTARLSQTLYEQSGEQRECENPIYGDQEETKTDLEREYLEDPSILK